MKKLIVLVTLCLIAAIVVPVFAADKPAAGKPAADAVVSGPSAVSAAATDFTDAVAKGPVRYDPAKDAGWAMGRPEGHIGDTSALSYR